jgi:hypothetical protein
MIPKSGNRFLDKVMLKTMKLDRDAIQLSWIRVQPIAGGNAYTRPSTSTALRPPKANELDIAFLIGALRAVFGT